jgi:hypothetical protein
MSLLVPAFAMNTEVRMATAEDIELWTELAQFRALLERRPHLAADLTVRQRGRRLRARRPLLLQ